jgi:hypothetical protein
VIYLIDLIFRMIACVVETHGRASRAASRLPVVASCRGDARPCVSTRTREPLSASSPRSPRKKRKNSTFATKNQNQNSMNDATLPLDSRGIATGHTPEDLKSRKRFITNFYANWIRANPTKHVYNVSLNSFIEIKFLSIQETASKAAIRYQSTLAVTYLTEILEKAVQKGPPQAAKKENEKQKRFSKIFILEYKRERLGTIKLTVGELRGSKQKIQYCITAIEND